MAYSHSIEVQFRDLDALGHVNHAVMVSYLEAARFAWWRAWLAGRPFAEEGFYIVRVEVDYCSSVLPGEMVRVELECTRVGSTSFDVGYRVFRGGGELAAKGRTVQVMVDFGTGRPRPIPEATRTWLREGA